MTGVPFLGIGPGVNADVGFYYQVSNATNLQELSGFFTYANVTAAFWNRWNGYCILE